MSLSEVDICNLALDKLGASRINSIAAPGNAVERRLSTAYPHYRDVELSTYRWKFALNYIRVTRTSPDFERVDKPYRYNIPTNVLKLYRRRGEDWERFGRQIISQISAGLDLKVLERKPVGDFTAEFCEVLACRLAKECAFFVTQNRGMVETAEELWEKAKAAAKAAESWETNPADEQIAVDPASFSWEFSREVGLDSYYSW